MRKPNGRRYVVFLSNEHYRASLVVRRIYKTLPDSEGAKRGLLRVVDESGEDYLYPEQLFATVALPKAVEKAFAIAT